MSFRLKIFRLSSCSTEHISTETYLKLGSTTTPVLYWQGTSPLILEIYLLEKFTLDYFDKTFREFICGIQDTVGVNKFSKISSFHGTKNLISVFKYLYV